MADRMKSAVLDIRDLHVAYGHSRALQGVNLTLNSGLLSLVGRNGMGKTTLCKSILSLLDVGSGSISFNGISLVGRTTSEVANLGVGYVPQGRRLWNSLTVEEHLRLVEKRGGAWNIDRIYSIFPKLADRRLNGGAQLSGGEQQMLAIGRALLLNPKLLVMDEPTEGLAPVIVNQLAELLVQLGKEDDISVLLIEQNIGFACTVSPNVAIMVNGRILRIMESSLLTGDQNLQQALLGVGRHAHDSIPDQDSEVANRAAKKPALNRVYISNPTIPHRWSTSTPMHLIENSARTTTKTISEMATVERKVVKSTAQLEGIVYVCGTLDTKKQELQFVRDRIADAGHKVKLVDLSTSNGISSADIPPHVIALHHPQGTSAVFTGDRGSAVAAMTKAFENWIRTREDIAGLIGAGGSGGTSILANGFRSTELGVPKIIVSTLASGDTAAYIGTSDLILMPSISDIQGLNRVSRRILSNAASALSGMVEGRRTRSIDSGGLSAVGISMFGVTTPCVRSISELLEGYFECVVFHATDIGTRAMESLIETGWLQGVIDISPTDVCDLIAGGVFAADENRFNAVIESGLPYIGACGALDMVNFRARDTVPMKYDSRNLYIHNPQITLMRTIPEECTRIGKFIGERLNLMQEQVRFFLPEGGLSALDAPDGPFWLPEANEALFKALETTVQQTANRQIIRVPHHINDPEFAELVVESHFSLTGQFEPLLKRA